MSVFNFIVQFKERRFLEAARKTIKNAELEAGSRLNTDQGISYMQKLNDGGAAKQEEEKKEWDSPMQMLGHNNSNDWKGKLEKVLGKIHRSVYHQVCFQRLI